MKETDSLQRFMFVHAGIRGEIAHLKETYQTIMNQRPYPAMVKNLLGEALISCLLLAGSIKFEGELSLQFQGDKRLPLLLVQCDHQLHLRAFAAYQEGLEIIDYAEAFLKGHMVLTINQYNKTKSYQSVVPIQATSMSICASILRRRSRPTPRRDSRVGAPSLRNLSSAVQSCHCHEFLGRCCARPFFHDRYRGHKIAETRGRNGVARHRHS